MLRPFVLSLVRVGRRSRAASASRSRRPTCRPGAGASASSSTRSARRRRSSAPRPPSRSASATSAIRSPDCRRLPPRRATLTESRRGSSASALERGASRAICGSPIRRRGPIGSWKSSSMQLIRALAGSRRFCTVRRKGILAHQRAPGRRPASLGLPARLPVGLRPRRRSDRRRADRAHPRRGGPALHVRRRLRQGRALRRAHPSQGSADPAAAPGRPEGLRSVPADRLGRRARRRRGEISWRPSAASAPKASGRISTRARWAS